MSESELTQMALTLEAHLDKLGWGDENSFIPKIIMVVKSDEGYRPRLLPIDGEMWSAAPSVGDMLRFLGRMLVEKNDLFTKALRQSIAETKPVALFLHTEGWSLTLPMDQKDEALEIGGKREIHKHPDRRETRVINGVLIDGSEAVGVMRMRGDDEPNFDGGFDGDVPDGLRALAAGFQYAIENGSNTVQNYIEDAIREMLDSNG